MTPLDFSKQFSTVNKEAARLGVQFGLEAELDRPDFVIEKGTPLFAVESSWVSLSFEEKSESFRRRARSVTFGEKPNLFRYQDRLDLHLDDTGNLEWTLGPSQDFPKLWLEFESLSEELGSASFQAMVSFPKEKVFSRHSVSEILGWFHFFQEFEILERAIEGLQLFRSKGRAPLQTFLHPYLGPMVQVRHKYLKKILLANAQGQGFDEESRKLVRVREQSFKYVGATTYRPDIGGPERIALEIRDAHRDKHKLQRRVLRVLHYWCDSLKQFSTFGEIPPFDSEKTFLSLPQEVKEFLETELKREMPERVKEFPKAKFVHETFRNFAYPFRNWSSFLEVFGQIPKLSQVEIAQENYLEKILKLKKQSLSSSENKIFLQLFLCEFVEESGLFEIFAREERSWTN